MALVGTISGSNGTTNTAVTGTLVIANTSTNFPQIPADAVLFVSGNSDSSSKAVFGGEITASGSVIVRDGTGTAVVTLSTDGNITGSNMILSGDLALNGGDLTTTAGTVNMFATAPVTMNFGATASVTTVNLNRTSNSSTTNVAGGNNTVIGAVKTVNIGANTGASAICNVNIGSSGALGRTTMQQDVFLTTGNLIGAPGSGANVMTLISSGNIIAKLDTDGSADGHKFIVQDFRNIEQFSVGENGNAELSGSLFVTGSITTSGTLKSDYSSGDEGGEIFLNRSVTNTVLTGGLTIDVYQNKLRLFEQGGANRGYFVDISEGGSAVSKNLIFTGSTNTFTSTAGSPFTLSIPPECGVIEIEICGGGGGGGGGKRNIAANGVYGGGGGSGGGYSFVSLRASTVRALSSNLTITIGASGSSGNAATVDGANGGGGGNGTATTVAAGATTILFAPGGAGGSGGTATNGTGGTSTLWKDAGGNGANSSNTGTPLRPPLAGFATGGGAGGGVDTGGGEENGGDGGIGGDIRVDNVNRAGAGGSIATPRNGGNASTSATYSPTGGGGGGGGAGRNGGGAAGDGGNGVQGSGGGGGGGSTNGNNSGSGGKGGEGWCIVRFI